MKLIELSGVNGRGKFCIVDDEDYPTLVKKRWWYHFGNTTKDNGYAFSKVDGNPYKNITMHRFIVQPPIGFIVDHVNGNHLDNRRSNLRICNFRQNQQNKKISKSNKSGYKGVVFEKRSNKNPWVAYIRIDNKGINLGCFATRELAALAYNNAAIKYFGDFAQLNVIKLK